VLLVSFFGYRLFRSRQILRLQEIRNAIAADLHDEIGSTLNSISIFSEVAKQKDERHAEALEMIGESSRTVLETMSDIVWTINTDNDSFEKIIFRMNSFAHNVFSAKGIEYSFNTDETLNEKKLSLEDRRNFYLVFKEAVNNIVKHSGAAEVGISLIDHKSHILMSIRDNGRGFDSRQETSGNGLKNMQRRATAMKARLEISSLSGRGTQIDLAINV
jgi:signal transduction histidine kinase